TCSRRSSVSWCSLPTYSQANRSPACSSVPPRRAVPNGTHRFLYFLFHVHFQMFFRPNIFTKSTFNLAILFF
ncbi:hypothetical protein L9F63_011087, partial [Diploptera punctata]